MTTRSYMRAARLPYLILTLVPVFVASVMTYSAGVENKKYGDYERVTCTWVLPQSGCVSTQPRYITIAVLCALVGVLLQLAVHYANAAHIGMRQQGITAMRWLKPCLQSPYRAFAITAIVNLALGMCIAIAIIIMTSNIVFIALGTVVLLVALWYVQGPDSMLCQESEAFVVFFFWGAIATVGTSVALNGIATFDDWFASGVNGLFATAALFIHNLATIDGDEAAGRKTLVVRLEKTPAKAVIFALVTFALTQAVLCVESAIYRFSSLHGRDVTTNLNVQFYSLVFFMCVMITLGIVAMVETAREHCKRGLICCLLAQCCFAISVLWYEMML